MTELDNKIVTTAESDPDNLIVGITPEPRVGNAIIKQCEGILKRGTLLAKSSKDASLVILGTTAGSGETLEPYGILTDDTDTTEGDMPATIYISGMFNDNKVICKDSYTMTEADKDTLRKYGIEFKAAFTS